MQLYSHLKKMKEIILKIIYIYVVSNPCCLRHWERAQRLRALAILSEDMSLLRSAHVVAAHNCQ